MLDLTQGTVIAGRYAVVRLLGTGATKRVYLADDTLTGGSVALALLIGPRSADVGLAARFSREGRAASALRSPYIARVFDVGKLSDGTRYLVTEAVLGRGLDQALDRGAVPPASAALWAAQILAALSEAHARGIIHRDVKPENVLLALEVDGVEVAKLTDFGLAKVLDGALEGSLAWRTAQDVVLGTPEYMAPEQWQGIAPDGRADVYATGVLLYEMLTGRVPFEGNTLSQVCIGHLNTKPPPFPADASPAIRALEPVVMRALAKRPEERFATADAMREALESASGVSLGVAPAVAVPALPPRSACAELVSDAFGGPVRLVASADALIGRDEGAHVFVRCVPPSEENDRRARTVSRRHATLGWRGGRAYITDLASRGGTQVGARGVGAEPAELRDGEEISLGRHVRFKFEHAPAAPGELPRWARLTRVDPLGGGQTFVLVLTEAKISSGPDAALRLAPGVAAGDVLTIRAGPAGLSVVSLGAPSAVPLHDGQTLRVGGVVISVAIAPAAA